MDKDRIMFLFCLFAFCFVLFLVLFVWLGFLFEKNNLFKLHFKDMYHTNSNNKRRKQLVLVSLQTNLTAFYTSSYHIHKRNKHKTQVRGIITI